MRLKYCIEIYFSAGKIHKSETKQSQLKSKINLVTRSILNLRRVLAALLLAPAVALCAPYQVGKSAALNRLVTPNGDGKNDTFIFRCYNPRYAAEDARIYDLAGKEVAKMRVKSSNNADFFDVLEWDPNAGGRKEGGIYIYRIRIETTVYKGTVTVIR